MTDGGSEAELRRLVDHQRTQIAMLSGQINAHGLLLEHLFCSMALQTADSRATVQAWHDRMVVLLGRTRGRPTGDVDLMVAVMAEFSAAVTRFYGAMARRVGDELQRRAGGPVPQDPPPAPDPPAAA